MGTDVGLLRLLQLVSPALPIGMYSYSQGMEKAIADGWLANSEDIKEWLSGIMNTGMLNIDLPLLARMYDAWQDLNLRSVIGWSQTLLAYRETAELRLEDRQCGQALARLLLSLGHEEMQSWIRGEVTTLGMHFRLQCRQGAHS